MSTNWQDHKDRLTAGEQAVLSELEKRGFMTSYYAPPCTDHFGVYAGSHGGCAHTLRKAMKRCLACCRIGKFWRCDHGQGEPAIDLFKRLCDEHLNGWKP